MNYSEPAEFSVNEVRFDYLGGWYHGRGLLTWKPDEGFHLVTFLQRVGASLPSSIAFGTSGLVPRSNIRSIRMQFADGDWGVAPDVLLLDRFDLVNENRLSLNFARIVFFHRDDGRSFTQAGGSALFSWSRSIHLPDRVQQKTSINDELVIEHSARRGLAHEDDLIRYQGLQDSADRAQLNWTLKSPSASRADSCRWAEGLRYALSIVGGSTVQTLHRAAWRGDHTIEEWTKPRETQALGVLAPLQERPFFNRDYVSRLAAFLACRGREQHVCRSMFDQLAAASTQKSWAARELLIATILEAALRTLHALPFKEGHAGSIDIKTELHRFRQRYLSEAWTPACDEAVRVHRRLRHRNAHPDWLASEDGALSEAELEKRLDDQIWLATFYGYMMLAMAGMPNLKPAFLPPHRQWPGALTLSIGHEQHGSSS